MAAASGVDLFRVFDALNWVENMRVSIDAVLESGALCEGAIYDKDGQLLTGSFMDYCMPRADHLPALTVGTTVTKCPSNPLGIKGCGEAGAIAAPAALINAVTDAIGTEAVAMPATSAAVWAALRKSGRSMPRAA